MTQGRARAGYCCRHSWHLPACPQAKLAEHSVMAGKLDKRCWVPVLLQTIPNRHVNEMDVQAEENAQQ